jgi:hypothetical protein
MVAKNAASDDPMACVGGSVRAGTVGDGDMTAVAECLFATARQSWGFAALSWPRRRRGRVGGSILLFRAAVPSATLLHHIDSGHCNSGARLTSRLLAFLPGRHFK